MRKLLFHAFDFSKVDGGFVIKDIPTGEYLVVANRSGEMTGRTPFGTVYFPGSAKREEARAIKVGNGEHVENLTLHIPKLERTITVTGRVQFSDGRPVANGHLQSIGEKGRQRLYVSSDMEGAFRLRLLAGQEVRLRAEWSVFDEALLMVCPEYRAAGTGRSWVELLTGEIFVSGERDELNVLLTLPVKKCDALAK